MRPFRVETGVLVPLDRSDVDTDQIIPKQFLKRIERSGYGPFLFHDWRQDPDFVLNREPFRDGGILVAGANFGCGSSREHAVWALADAGFHAIIAPSFADIFRGNARTQGLLTVELGDADVRQLLDAAQQTPGVRATVDLEEQTVTAAGHCFAFHVDDYERHLLLEGLDDIALTLQHEAAITAHESRRPAWMPSLERSGA